MQFGNKGKLSSRYIGPCNILRQICDVAYELDLPLELGSTYMIFRMSLLRKCVGAVSFIVSLKNVGVKEIFTFKEVPIEILD